MVETSKERKCTFRYEKYFLAQLPASFVARADGRHSAPFHAHERCLRADRSRTLRDARTHARKGCTNMIQSGVHVRGPGGSVFPWACDGQNTLFVTGSIYVYTPVLKICSRFYPQAGHEKIAKIFRAIFI